MVPGPKAAARSGACNTAAGLTRTTDTEMKMVRANDILALAKRLRKRSRRAENDAAFDLKAASNYLEELAKLIHEHEVSEADRGER
jgi:hypothetical protein